MPAAKPRVVRVCAQCGLEYSTVPSLRKKYCSRQCMYDHNSRERSTQEDFVGLKGHSGDTVPCAVCGTEFYREPALIKKGAKYCSRKCHNVAQTKRVTKECAYCGREFKVTRNRRDSAQYCTLRCRSSELMLRQTGRTYNDRPAKVNSQGYVMVWEPAHPNKSFRGWQLEHRLVAERELGRYLTSDEHVHHVNEVKTDNRPENLQVMERLDHVRLTVENYRNGIAAMKAELEEYRRRYGPLQDWSYEREE